jgi:putative transposase
MPRQSRIDAPGALHHVIVRGIERRNIFRDDQDRYNFLERMGALVEGTATVCYAWALIPNHFHLLLRTGAAPIATFMRRLLTGHAVSFNPACSGTTAAMGTCSRTGTNRSCARKIPICSNWCVTFI